MKNLMACLLAAGLTTAIPYSQAMAATPAFRKALEAHLTAVSTRNMDALLPTLTSGQELTMIAPNGFKFETRQQYVDFHRQWFAAKDNGQRYRSC